MKRPNNRATTYTAFALALLALSATLAACAGFDLGDVVRVKTPNDIRQTTGLPRTTTLNEAQAAYAAWLEDTQRAAAQWRASIETGDQIRAMLAQLSLNTLSDIGPTLAGVPVAGPALPAITGLAGLFLGAGRLRKEKEASFNKGLKEGRVAPPTTAAPTN